jgi:hypothetical protein
LELGANFAALVWQVNELSGYNLVVGYRRICFLMLVAAQSGAGQAGSGPVPTFLDYPADDTWFLGKVHRPVLVREEEKRLGEELSRHVFGRPNFAGQYVVVKLFCNPACQRIAVVDARDGTVYASPFQTKESAFALPPPTWDIEEPTHVRQSKLLIVPNVCPEGPSACGTYCFVWEENRFRLIRKVPVSAVPIIPEKSPLLGSWKGKWSYTNGYEEPTQHFTLRFVEKSGRIRGSYTEARSTAIKGLVATKVDKSTYRMEILGDCWKVSVDRDKLSGLMNGGACGATGMGAGARLSELRAERVR